MLNKLFRYFLPEVDYSEENEAGSYNKKNRYIFIMFAFISIVTALLFSIVFYFQENTIAMTVNLVVPPIMLGILFLYKYFDWYRPLVFLYSLCNFIIIATAHATSPVLIGSNMIWYPLILIVAYIMLYDKKFSWAVSGFAIVAFSSAEYASSQELFNYSYKTMSANQVTIFNIISLIAGTVVAHIVGQIIIDGEKSVIKTLVERGKETLLAKEQSASLLSIVSHDIANPLQLVDTYLLRLRKNVENGVMPEAHVIEKMQKSVDKITAIIKSSRELRAVEQGKTSIRLAPTSIKSAFSDMETALRPKLEEKEINLQYYWPNDFKDVLVNADTFSLVNNVFLNVVSNAIKFSHKGEDIDIRVRVRSEKVSIEIRDYGVGIPKELMPLIFSATDPTSREGTDGEKGTGFGLPIVKMFMELYGGTIQVKSESNQSVSSLKKGTLFILNFDRYIADEKSEKLVA